MIRHRLLILFFCSIFTFHYAICFGCLLDPDSFPDLDGFQSFDLGRRYYHENEHENARKHFIDALEVCPKPCEGWAYHQTSSRHPWVDTFYQPSSDYLDAIYRHSHYYLGRIYFEIEDYEQARFHFSMAIGGYANRWDKHEEWTACFLLTDPSWFIDFGLCDLALRNYSDAIASFGSVSFHIEELSTTLDRIGSINKDYYEILIPNKRNMEWVFPWLIIALNSEALAYHLESFDLVKTEADDNHFRSLYAINAAIELHEGRKDPEPLRNIPLAWPHNDRGWGYYKRYNPKNQHRPPDATLYSNRGFFFYEIEKYDRALTDFSTVIQLTPDEPDGYLNRAMVYLTLGRWSDAICDYNKSIELNPYNPDIYQNRSLALFLNGSTQLAKADLEKSHSLKQLQAYHDNDQGFNAYLSGNYGKALNFFSKFVKTHSDNAIGFLNKGKAHYALNQFEQAIHAYDIGLQIDSQCWQLYQERGLSYLALSNFDAAEEDFFNALVLSPNNPLIHQNLGTVYFSVGNFQKAIENYEKALPFASKAEKQRTYRSLGMAHYEMKNYEKAVSYFDLAIKLGSEDPLLYLVRGLSFYAEEHYNRAIDSYSHLINLEPNNTQAYLHRGKAYYENEEFQNALQDYNRLISHNSFDPAAYRLRGLTYLSLGLQEEALNDFLYAVEIEKPQLETSPQMLQAPTSPIHIRGNLIEQRHRLRSLDGSKMFPFASLDVESGLMNANETELLFKTIDYVAFSKGMTTGVFQGGIDCVKELGPFAYNLLFHPIQTTTEVLESLELLTQYIFSQQWDEVAQALAPELRELYLNWHQLSDMRKGELAGIALGKYGIGVLTGVGTVKLAKTLKNVAISSKVGEIIGFKKAKTALPPVPAPYPPIYPEGSWVLPERGGAIIGKRYYTEHALARMAPKNNEAVIELLEKRFWFEAEKRGFPRTEEGKIAFLKTDDGQSFRVDPRGIPPSIIEAEIANPGLNNGLVIKMENEKVITVWLDSEKKKNGKKK